MTGPIRSNNNNALAPATMPPAGRTGARGARPGGNVPSFLHHRRMGCAGTTVLARKFAAVGYHPAAIAGFVTGYDTDKLSTRHEGEIRRLLEALEKEFPEFESNRIFYEDTSTDIEKHYLRSALNFNAELYGMLGALMPAEMATYFCGARMMEVTIRVLRTVLSDLRKDGPAAFDREGFARTVEAIATDGLGAFVATALKAELAEVRFGERAAVDTSAAAFKKIVIPACIVFMEELSSVAARSRLVETAAIDLGEPMSGDGALDRFSEDDATDANEGKKKFVERGVARLRKKMVVFAESEEKSAYIEMMQGILRLYADANPAQRLDPRIVDDFYYAMKTVMQAGH